MFTLFTPSRWFGGFLLLILASSVHSHALWSPDGLIKPRSNRDNIKTGPCGVARTNQAVTLVAGSTVDLSIKRTIFHKGYFRIAFSAANDQGFDENILKNNIPETSSQTSYTVSVKLPDTECSACTLQLIQVMLDSTPSTNYYSCADIKLVRNPTPGDLVPPASVTALLGLASDKSVDLNWTNPKDSDFAGVMILENSSNAFTAPQTGKTYKVADTLGTAKVVYYGLGVNTQLTPRNPGTYFYKVHSFDQNLNFDAGIATQVTLAANNVNLAPNVALKAEQNRNTVTNAVTTSGGPVIVQANVSDANTGQTHSFDWSGSDSRLKDTDVVSSQFTFDPSALAAGDYKVQVKITDNGTPPLSSETSLTFKVTKPAAKSGAWAPVLGLILLAVACTRRNRRKTLN